MRRIAIVATACVVFPIILMGAIALGLMLHSQPEISAAAVRQRLASALVGHDVSEVPAAFAAEHLRTLEDGGGLTGIIDDAGRNLLSTKQILVYVHAAGSRVVSVDTAVRWSGP